MADARMIYNGVERTVIDGQSPLQLFKGPESKIKERKTIQDGALYFATDTKKIYLDCDFTDSESHTLHDRLAFGGSSGFFYSSKEFAEVETDFNFYFNEIEGVLDLTDPDEPVVINLPKTDDVIFDETNGSFFRVDRVDETLQLVTTRRMTVAGNGSGGGGTGGGGVASTFAATLVSRSVAYSTTADSMILRYVAYSESEIEGLTNQIDIEVYDRSSNTKLFTMENIQPSATRNTIVDYDIKNYIHEQLDRHTFSENHQYSLAVIFTDGNNRSASQTLSLALASLYVTPETESLQDFDGDASYGVVPRYDSALIRNPKIIYSVIDQQYGTSYQTGEILNITNGTASHITLTYQAGRPVTVITQVSGTIGNTTITSATLSQSVMFVDPSNPVPRINVLSWPSESSYAAYASNVKVVYRVSYPSAQVTSLEGHLLMYKKNDNGIFVIDRDILQNFTIGQNLTWDVAFENEGVYQLVLTVGSGANKQTVTSPQEYTISGSSGVMPIVTADAQFDFTPDKNETSPNKENWSTTWFNPDGQETAAGGAQAIGNTIVEAQFKNFNWTTNGWFAVNANKNKLVLNNGAKLTFPVAPFYGAFNSNTASYTGAITTGKTIEFDVKISNIRDRKQRIINCASYNTQRENWESDEPVVGIIATGDYFALTDTSTKVLTDMQTKGVVGDNVNGLVAYYSADERVHICYVIARNDADIDTRTPRNYIYVYVNGVLSGIVARDSNMRLRQDSGEGILTATIFDSTYADIELYNFRFYGKALSAEAVLDNYLAGLGDADAAMARKAANNVTEYNAAGKYSYVSLQKVIESASIPYLVLRGGYRTDKKGTKMTQSADNAEVSLPYFDKKDYRYVEAYFVDPNDEDRCFGINMESIQKNSQGKIIGFTATSADRWHCTIYPQGTSSLEYPVKNLRLNTVKKKYKLFSDIPACKIFTLKADYMDSSMSHNTGTANQLNDLYASANIELTPKAALKNTSHQYANTTLLTAIKGRPCVIFYYPVGIDPTDANGFTGEDSFDKYEYIGRYNFNLDKSQADLFGFFSDEATGFGFVKNGNDFVPGYEAIVDSPKDLPYDPEQTYYKYVLQDGIYQMVPWTPNSEETAAKNYANYLKTAPLYLYKEKRNSIQCWEMKNNNNDLTSFRTPWDDNADKDPKPTYDENNQQIGMTDPYPIWIAGYESRYPDYDNQQMTDKRAFSAFLNWLASTNMKTATNNPIPEVTLDGVTYTTDSAEYRLAKFKNEFDRHMDRDFVTFYYIMTELEVLMDSRAKNMMMVSYDADNETGTGIWYPIFYDMDTAMGVNNTGKLVYRYDVRDTNFGIYNTTADYPRDAQGNIDPNGSGEYSVLWANFRLCFANGYSSPVAVMYRQMRKGNLNLNFLLNTYNNKLANAWVETLINQDEWYKYIRPKDEPNWLYNSSGQHVLIDSVANEQDNSEYQQPDHSQYWQVRDTNYSDLLYAAQGTRSEHRKQWLKRRLLLLDGKYAADGSAFKYSFRVNPLPASSDYTETERKQYTLNLTADDSSYVWINFSANSLTQGSPRGPIYIPEGETNAVRFDNMPTDEQEAIMLFVQNITHLGNLGYLGMANINVTNNSGVNTQFKLREFDVSLNAYQQAQRNNRGLNGNNEKNPWTRFDGGLYPLLQVANLDNQYMSLTAADVSSNTYLRIFSAKNTYLNTVSFPVGGILETVYVPNTLTTLALHDQPLLTTVQCDNDGWESLDYLDISGCPKLDTKSLFKAAKNKTNAVAHIQLTDLNWKLDPTDPTECTLDASGTMIVDFPILNQLITTAGLEGSAPWSTTSNSKVATRYYVGGTIKINNGMNYGLNAVAIKEKYSGCYPNLEIAYDTNDLVTSSYTVSFFNTNKTAITNFTKQYTFDVVPTLSAQQLCAHLDVREFGKPKEVQYTYRLVGFKTSDDEDTDLFIEAATNQSQNPEAALAQAHAAARAASSIYVDVSWTTINENNPTTYNSEITYYKSDEIIDLLNENNIWTPSANAVTEEEKQAELNEYIKTDNLYVYNGTTYTFADDFALTPDNKHREVNFYPVYVAEITRYTVKFYNSDDPLTAGVANVQSVRYRESATDPATLNLGIVKIVCDENDRTHTTVYTTINWGNEWKQVTHGSENNSYTVKIYPQFSNPQNMQDVATAESWFTSSSVTQQVTADSSTITGVMLTLKDNYPYTAVTIPKTYNGQTVVGLNNTKRAANYYVKKLADPGTTASAKPALEEALASATDAPLRRIYFEAGNTLQYIHSFAFAGYNLDYVDFAGCPNLKMIGENNSTAEGAFMYCNSLKVGTALPAAMVTLGAYTFKNCTTLDVARFPQAIRYIGRSCFENCVGLTTVALYDAQHDNAAEVNITYLANIGANAFAQCTNLCWAASYLFPYITEIGNSAFNGCSQLSMFEDEAAYTRSGQNLQTLGSSAFYNCSNLRLAFVPNNVTQLKANVFGNTSVVLTSISANIMGMEAGAFYGVTFNDTIYWTLDAVRLKAGAYNFNENCLNQAKLKNVIITIQNSTAANLEQSAEAFYALDSSFKTWKETHFGAVPKVANDSIATTVLFTS